MDVLHPEGFAIIITESGRTLEAEITPVLIDKKLMIRVDAGDQGFTYYLSPDAIREMALYPKGARPSQKTSAGVGTQTGTSYTVQSPTPRSMPYPDEYAGRAEPGRGLPEDATDTLRRQIWDVETETAAPVTVQPAQKAPLLSGHEFVEHE